MVELYFSAVITTSARPPEAASASASAAAAETSCAPHAAHSRPMHKTKSRSAGKSRCRVGRAKVARHSEPDRDSSFLDLIITVSPVVIADN